MTEKVYTPEEMKRIRQRLGFGNTGRPCFDNFDDWRLISDDPPKDGSYFMGGHEFTGSVYTTHYHPRWWSRDEILEGDVSKAIVWWTLEPTPDKPDNSVSYAPTHWRPL